MLAIALANNQTVEIWQVAGRVSQRAQEDLLALARMQPPGHPNYQRIIRQPKASPHPCATRFARIGSGNRNRVWHNLNVLHAAGPDVGGGGLRANHIPKSAPRISRLSIAS